jgi:hypothetical protein
MIAGEFKARIVDDFKNKWFEANANDENMDLSESIICYDSDDLTALHNRISGQVVTMTENIYPIGSNDFFEKVDNNFVVYPELFEEVSDELR